MDFIVYGPRGFWAIEVKRSANVSFKNVKALKIFKEEYPEAQCFLIYGEDMRKIIQEIPCISSKEFLKNLNPNDLILM